MKTIRNTLAVLAVLIALPALGQIVTLINAVETAPSNIILPASINGMMTFRPCAEECEKEHERVRLTPETKFSIDGKGMRWEDFRKEFPTVRNNDGAYALVSYETKNNVLVSLEVSR